MIRVLIADDHFIVRQGLVQLFGLMGDIVVAGDVANGEALLETLKTSPIDLILLDLSMPGLSGVKLIEAIRTCGWKMPILVLSMHDDLQTAKRVMQAGASGYVAKFSEQETLLAAIRKVAVGARFIDPAIVEQLLIERPRNDDGELYQLLSPRELQIMKLVGRGKSNVEIGDALFISNKTVSTHKARLMQKLNLSNTADLVRYAVDHGLID